MSKKKLAALLTALLALILAGCGNLPSQIAPAPQEAGPPTPPSPSLGVDFTTENKPINGVGAFTANFAVEYQNPPEGKLTNGDAVFIIFRNEGDPNPNLNDSHRLTSLESGFTWWATSDPNFAQLADKPIRKEFKLQWWRGDSLIHDTGWNNFTLITRKEAESKLR